MPKTKFRVHSDIHDLASLTPVNFFELKIRCFSLPTKGAFPRLSQKNKQFFSLPNLSFFCHEELFAEGSIGWNEEGVELFFVVDSPGERCRYPDIMRGESIELFFDTRDIKTSGYNTRYCHHFFFLPEAVEGHQKGEITHFRTEDRHEWCDPQLLGLKTKVEEKGYAMHIWIPKECLTGYDPEQFNRLGFAYRINRSGAPAQHFSVVTEDYKLEEQPSLWSHCLLVRT